MPLLLLSSCRRHQALHLRLCSRRVRRPLCLLLPMAIHQSPICLLLLPLLLLLRLLRAARAAARRHLLFKLQLQALGLVLGLRAFFPQPMHFVQE
jgi:hypothetical protein